MTPTQVKFALTIYAAGNDLLALISDILDLSKIEAGKLDVHPAPIALSRLLAPVVTLFEPIAKSRHLPFAVELTHDASIETDAQRVQQILNNLLSNAFKFTEHGRVGLHVEVRETDVLFSVRDTGVGIARSQHSVIFEAFRQADGTTNRRFGGTGLGLSICRELSRLLGGEIRLESQPGQGSEFTLALPLAYGGHAGARAPVTGTRTPHDNSPARRPDTWSARERPLRELSQQEAPPPAEGFPRLLVIDNDAAFADVVMGVATEQRMAASAAHSAEEGFRAALEQQPSIIVLDVNLPDHSGLAVLDRLKRHGSTRHAHVLVASVDEVGATALPMGAVSCLVKPVRREELAEAIKKSAERLARLGRLLIVDADPTRRQSIGDLAAGAGVDADGADTASAALARLASRAYDCVVSDVSFPDGSVFDVLDILASAPPGSRPPVILYSARSLTVEEEERLRQFDRRSLILRRVQSAEQLVEETSLFLHRQESDLSAEQQRLLQRAEDGGTLLDKRKILLVEDDVRSIFALTSILEPRGAQLLIARNGREALEELAIASDVDLILMDVMMPEMDGITAIAKVRALGGRWRTVPIIAITAKVMDDERQRCIDAGASDFIAKPLNVESLLSLVRVWLGRVPST